MKIVRRGALPVGSESGLLRGPRPRACAAEWRETARGDGHARGRLGSVRRARARRSSTSTRSRRCGSSSTPRTGWPARCCRPCSTRLPQVDVVRCYFEPDGIVPEPRAEPAAARRTASSSSRKTREEGADFGVAYDGDADRCFFVDDTGEFVPGDFTTALFAESILAKEPGGKVIYDVRASWAVPRGDRGARAASRSSTASATRSSSSGCATRTPSSPARSRRTTTSATSRRPTRA